MTLFVGLLTAPCSRFRKLRNSICPKGGAGISCQRRFGRQFEHPAAKLRSPQRHRGHRGSSSYLAAEPRQFPPWREQTRATALRLEASVLCVSLSVLCVSLW